MDTLDDFRIETWLDSDGLWKRIDAAIETVRTVSVNAAVAASIVVSTLMTSNLTSVAPSEPTPEYVRVVARTYGASGDPVEARIYSLGVEIERRLTNLRSESDVDVDPDLLARIEAAMAKNA